MMPVSLSLSRSESGTPHAPASVEEAQWALGPRHGRVGAALSVVIERDDSPGAPVDIEIADEAGSMGRISVDGAHLLYRGAHRNVSSNLLAYFARRVCDVAASPTTRWMSAKYPPE